MDKILPFSKNIIKISNVPEETLIKDLTIFNVNIKDNPKVDCIMLF